MATAATKIKAVPIGERVVVEVHKADEVTEGGIILPDSAQEKPNIGVVVATNIEEIAVGDAIIFERFGPSEVAIDEKPLKIVSKDHILVKLTEE
jgi:chaperonin GroES